MNMSNNFGKLGLMFGFLFCFGLCMIGDVSASSYNADKAYSFYFDCFFEMLCDRKVPLLMKECIIKLDNRTKEVIYELLIEATPAEKQYLCGMDVYWSDERILTLSNDMVCKFSESEMETLSEIFAGPMLQHFAKVCSTFDGRHECQKLEEYNACFHILIEESMKEGYCKSMDKSMFAFKK